MASLAPISHNISSLTGGLQPFPLQRASIPQKAPHLDKWAPSDLTRLLISGDPVLRKTTRVASSFWMNNNRKAQNIKRVQQSKTSENDIVFRRKRSVNTNQCYSSFINNGLIQGVTYKVHKSHSDWQHNPDLIRLKSGKTLLTWKSKNQVAIGSYEIYGRLVDSNGNFIGSEFPIKRLPGYRIVGSEALSEDKIAIFYQKNTGPLSPVEINIFDTKTKSMVRTFSMGSEVSSYGFCFMKNEDLLLVYQHTSGSIHAQINSLQGKKLLRKELPLSTIKVPTPAKFFVTELLNGSIIISYEEKNLVKGGVFSQRLQHLNKLFTAFSNSKDDLSRVFLKGLPNGNFLFSCVKKDRNSLGSIRIEILSEQGEATGRYFEIDIGAFQDISYSLTVVPVSGDIVVAWDKKMDWETQEIKIQTFSSTSGMKGREVSIREEQARFVKEPTVSYLKDGKVFLSWQQHEMDVFGKTVILTDLLLKKISKEDIHKYETAKKCLINKTSLHSTLEKERQKYELHHQKNINDSMLLNDTLKEEKQKYRDQIFAEKIWRIVCLSTSPVILISMIMNIVLSVLLKKRRESSRLTH